MNKGDVFLYNTLNTNVLASDSPPVIKLVKKLQRGNNLRVIKLERQEIKRDADIDRFVKKARERLMMEIIPGRKGSNKPVQFMPIIGLKKETKEKGGAYSFARQGISYLNELSIFINGECGCDCTICADAYRQFNCCRRTPPPQPELNLESIKEVLAGTPSLARLNVLGGNIFKYAKFPALMECLKETTAAVNLYSHYLNPGLAAVDPGNLSHPAVVLNMLIPLPVLEEELKNVFILLDKHDPNLNVVFIVQSEKELIQVGETVKKNRIKRFSISPYYNGRNETFFKKHVFVKKRVLLDAKPSIKEIYSRSIINRNYFGKLVILSNGDIHSNINEKPLGNIRTDSLRKILYKELQGSSSWLLTRDKIEPCRECHYRFLCPSISNYDYAIGKHNLCTIRSKNRNETTAS